MHRENRLPQGREHGAVTPRAREPKRLWPWPLPLPATTARARLHGSQIQMARGAARREPWPQSWSLLGPSIVPAARAANNLMRVPCVRDRSATDVPVWPCACTRGAEALPCLASPGRGSVPAASARPYVLVRRRARAPRLLPYGIAMASCCGHRCGHPC